MSWHRLPCTRGRRRLRSPLVFFGDGDRIRLLEGCLWNGPPFDTGSRRVTSDPALRDVDDYEFLLFDFQQAFPPARLTEAGPVCPLSYRHGLRS